MPDYLSKEEIRKWRSSLERITLEEYAARLGKVIQEDKHDDSLVDSVILKSLNSMTTERYMPGTEKIHTLSLKSFNKEREINERKEIKPVKEISKKEEPVVKSVNSEEKKQPEQRPETEKEIKRAKEAKVTKEVKETKETKIQNREKEVKPAKETTSNENLKYSFKKALTPREQLVFDHFLDNKNTVVFAADLARILDLPRDYVYKYIKNLRSKLNEDILQNAENGGYLLRL